MRYTTGSTGMPDELTAPYRETVFCIERAVKAYDGTEARYQALMGELIQLEHWMINAFGGSDEARRLPDVQERAIAKEYSEDHRGRSISGYLDAASYSLRKLLHKHSTTKDLLEELHILHVQSENVILPPGDTPGPQSGSGAGWEVTEYQERLQWLIQLLQDWQIYTDDLVIMTGATTPAMIRRESYILVEIPRLAKEVLVCNQVGEATFVCDRMFGRNFYVQHSKEHLEGYPGIHRIVCQNKKQWETDLACILFQQREKPRRKINVRDREAVRAQILATVTPEQWEKFDWRQRRNFGIHSFSIQNIGMLFGIANEEDVRAGVGFWLLGEQIFGVDNPVVQKNLAKVLAHRESLTREKIQSTPKLAELGNDPAKWRVEIQSLVPVETWLKMDSRARRKLVIHGKRIVWFARLFGISGSPLQYDIHHLELAAKIWGEDSERITKILPQARKNWEGQQSLRDDPVLWAGKLRETVTLDEWLLLNNKTVGGVKIFGVGINRIGTIFGEKKFAYSYRDVRLRIALRVWPEERARIQKLLDEYERQKKECERIEAEGQKTLGENPDLWKIAIRQRTTLQEWQRTDFCFQLYGKGLLKIAKIFGIRTGGRSCNRTLLRLQLALQIWGDVEPSVVADLQKRITAFQDKAHQKNGGEGGI